MSTDGYPWNLRRLRAASRILRTLGLGGKTESTLRDSWRVMPVGGQIDFDEFEETFHALKVAGLIEEADGLLLPDKKLFQIAESASSSTEELLYTGIITAQCPLWLRTATSDGNAEHVSEELIPENVARGLASIIWDPARREAVLLSRARRVQADAMQRLGEQAEITAMRCLRDQLNESGHSSLVPQVCRVSQISDELGYDIVAPRLDGSPRRLEVKGSRRVGATASIVVTANEMAVGKADPDWYLLVVEVSDEPVVVGWVTARMLEPFLPEDRHERGRWVSARVRVPRNLLTPGLPTVSALVKD